MLQLHKSASVINILKITTLRNILIISAIIATALPLFNMALIYPSFGKTLTKITEDEALRVARHLMSMIIADQSDLVNDTLPLKRLDEIREVSNDFKLMKLKFFSRSGKIIYSTDPEEIGDINRKTYFHDILAKGDVYTKVVKKDAASLEGKKVTTDVVETYVPMMRNDAFTGAFEIYYDITARKEEMDKLLFSSSVISFILAISLLGAILIVLFRASKDVTMRGQAEAALQKAHDELERKVAERTAELVKTNERLRGQIAERERAEEALWSSEKKLRVLSSQLLTAQENERERIAHELHDGLGQTLSAVKYKVESVLGQTGESLTEGSVKSLSSLITLVQNGIEEVRRISMDLRPSTLDDLGILATTAWFCRVFRSTYPGIHVEEQIEIEEDEVPESLKIIIYRVLQESLNNMAKHSQADRVLLSLRKKEGGLELVIEDNGRGFDPKDAPHEESFTSGFGLASMRRRVESSGGLFAISSSTGAGTVVLASWSLERVKSNG